jgi:DNA-binding Xre family transcriptional regulator
MSVSYKKLFHLMIEKNITAPHLQKQAGFSGNILTRLRRNSYVSLQSIETICRVLDCKIDDILEFVPDRMQDGESN